MSDFEAEPALTAPPSPNPKGVHDDSSGPSSSDDNGGGSHHVVTNKYYSKKILAQGMFDIALLSSNVNQLVHILTIPQDADPTHGKHKLQSAAIVLLITSIVLQVFVGICLVLVTAMQSRLRSRQGTWKGHLNDITTLLVFIITVISVIIPSLTAGYPTPLHNNNPQHSIGQRNSIDLVLAPPAADG